MAGLRVWLVSHALASRVDVRHDARCDLSNSQMQCRRWPSALHHSWGMRIASSSPGVRLKCCIDCGRCSLRSRVRDSCQCNNHLYAVFLKYLKWKLRLLDRRSDSAFSGCGGETHFAERFGGNQSSLLSSPTAPGIPQKLSDMLVRRCSHAETTRNECRRLVNWYPVS